MDRDALDIRDTNRGCRLRVRVKPGARTEAVLAVHDGALKIAVAAPPERGKANEALTTFVAGILGIRRTQVAVMAGRRSQHKSLEIEGLDAKEVVARIARARGARESRMPRAPQKEVEERE